jgi:hypothetical protein
LGLEEAEERRASRARSRSRTGRSMGFDCADEQRTERKLKIRDRDEED